ncbi:uncharacterized protein CbrC (UPF0167 family) [Caulobacter ginsengisoli]|uniref:Uncharacterized protein CbrC (UPF0167 family) n=1 Tax=Caulobacter ginsengisoli TaxID=400775 RepID=A0ABU0IQA9_9CAUL|nr:hypothetical protein [Caulobacter ginsengisoli]MDQ0464200.1 uncharacterized protein CbrC (UPF0167 family) [Caulobacter ginsengisoli]
MVYIVWGSAYKQRPYGTVEQGDCPTCGEQKPFRHRVIYKMRHIWYLARWVTDRRYANQCLTCGHAERVPQKVAQQGFKRPGIPVWDRWGWAGFLGAVAAFVVWVGISDAADHRRDQAMLAQPVAGDLYKLDLAKLVDNPERPEMDAIVRVEQVDAKQVIVRLPKTYYDGPRAT